jgi:hypothetical protein
MADKAAERVTVEVRDTPIPHNFAQPYEAKGAGRLCQATCPPKTP